VSGGGGPNSTWAIASGVWAGEAAADYAARSRARGAVRLPAQADRVNVQANGGPDADACAATIETIQSEMFPLERNFTREEITMRSSLRHLDSAWREFETAKVSSQNGGSPDKARETAAMLASARWIYASALQRRETRGIHRRRDHPAWTARRSLVFRFAASSASLSSRRSDRACQRRSVHQMRRLRRGLSG